MMSQNSKRKLEILERLGVILKEHDGLESNIPVSPNAPHEYWLLKNELNGIYKTPNDESWIHSPNEEANKELVKIITEIEMNKEIDGNDNGPNKNSK